MPVTHSFCKSVLSTCSVSSTENEPSGDPCLAELTCYWEEAEKPWWGMTSATQDRAAGEDDAVGEGRRGACGSSSEG